MLQIKSRCYYRKLEINVTLFPGLQFSLHLCKYIQTGIEFYKTRYEGQATTDHGLQIYNDSQLGKTKEK